MKYSISDGELNQIIAIVHKKALMVSKVEHMQAFVDNNVFGIQQIARAEDFIKEAQVLISAYDEELDKIKSSLIELKDN